MSEHVVATVITNDKIEEKTISITCNHKKNGKGDFIINAKDVVIEIPIKEIRRIIDV